MNFLDKLNYLMSEKGLNRHSLSEQSGIPYTTIDGWYKRGYEGAKISTIIRLADFFNVELDYFVRKNTESKNLAQLSTELPDRLSAEEIALLSDYHSVDDHGKKLVRMVLLGEVRRVQSNKPEPEPDMDMIVYNFPAAAGVPMWAEDDSYERITFPASKVPVGADFGIRISGDSMEPTIPAGSIVFVRKVADLRSGEIGIFMVEDEAVCKRFTMDKRGVVLLSDNESYEPLIIKGHQRFTVTGKVLGYK